MTNSISNDTLYYSPGTRVTIKRRALDGEIGTVLGITAHGGYRVRLDSMPDRESIVAPPWLQVVVEEGK